jgi:hypothetical protein
VARRVHTFGDGTGSAEVTGFQDRNQRWNHLGSTERGLRWFTGPMTGEADTGRHAGRGPDDSDLQRGRMFNVTVQHGGKEYHYVYKKVGRRRLTGADIEADFRARLDEGYFQPKAPA